MARPVAMSKSDGLTRVAAMFAEYASTIEESISDTPKCLERDNLEQRAAWARVFAQELALGMFDDVWKEFVGAELQEFRVSVLRIQKKYLDRQRKAEEATK